MEILAFIAFVAIVVFINRMIRKGVNAGVNGFINQVKKRLEPLLNQPTPGAILRDSAVFLVNLVVGHHAGMLWPEEAK